MPQPGGGDVGAVSLRREPSTAVVAGPPLIVIADRDASVRDAVHSFMSARGYRVESAGDVESAAGLLASYNVEVLISDLALRGADGVDLLSIARASAPATRRIALTADTSPRDRDAALREGAVRVLVKPLSLLELADAVGLANDCADGFHGWMHRLALVDLLQMYHHAAQSLVLHVRGEVEGTIALRNGELIHAEHKDLVGMPALIELLRARRGQLETTALEHVQRTLVGPFDHVLLDGLRALDEVRGAADAVTSQLFDEAGGDDWLVEEDEAPAAPDPLDDLALRAWLVSHAPGAGVWRVEPETATLVRLDETGARPEIELASPPGTIGWAYELAERGDPSWTRVELRNGSTAIALLRVASEPRVVIAFARLISGEAMQRQFHVETARLQRWLIDHIGGAA